VCINTTGSFCDPGSGSCVPVPYLDGTPCDDDSVCTVNDVCVTPVSAMNFTLTPICEGLPNVTCLEPPGVCQFPGLCDPFSGACTFSNMPTGTPCNLTSPDLCEPTGQCILGFCVPVAFACPPSVNQCDVALCNASAVPDVCSFVPLPNGVPCDDGDACTENDICTGGVCGGTLKDCLPTPVECVEPIVPCSGACSYTPLPNETPCMAGDGECQAGICVPICTPDCGPNGICVSLDPDTCLCTGGYSGALCDTAPLPPPPSVASSTANASLEFAAEVSRVLFALLIFAPVVTLACALACVCGREPYVQDLRKYKGE
jgi:hypothetical protein